MELSKWPAMTVAAMPRATIGMPTRFVSHEPAFERPAPVRCTAAEALSIPAAAPLPASEAWRCSTPRSRIAFLVPAPL